MKQIALSQDKFAIVDDEDFDQLKKFNWSVVKNKNTFYAMRKDERKKSILMHRVILNAPADLQVDHINGNGLDNRRANLRLVTPRKNTINRTMRSTNKSGYSGVYQNPKTEKYIVRISLHVGSFDTFDEAVAARQKAEDQFYGEFTRRRSLEITGLNT